MAIMAYTGVMGSGKSYEGVSSAALTALKAGRRVVTNISGFNYERVRDFLGRIFDGELLSADKVVVVPSKRIVEEHFFYDPELKVDSIVQPGDLVLIDEVWAFWGSGQKLLAEHMKFFRMHRHYTEVDSGVSCDLVLMIQDLSSLHRFIRGVLATNFKFTKMISLGISWRYRVEVYEGGAQKKSCLVSVSNKSYDKRIFPLYKSYDGVAGKEKTVDGRSNLLNNRWFLGSVIVAFVGLIWGSWWFVGYVINLRKGGTPSLEISATTSPVVKPQGGAVTTQAAASAMSMPSVQMSVDARLVGVFQLRSGESFALVQMGDGRIVRQRMDAGIVDGWQSQAASQGKMVTFSFGGKAK
jgi:zona occludens toxin